LEILQDHTLNNTHVSLGLLKILLDMVPTVPYAEIIASTWSPEKIKKLCKCDHVEIRIHALNFVASMAEHVSREDKEKQEIERVERERKFGDPAKAPKPVELSQPLLSVKFIAAVPPLASEAFLPAIVSNDEKVKTAAINGVIKVINTKELATAFLNSPGFELLLNQSASPIKSIRPLTAVALSRIFVACANVKLSTEVCTKILTGKLDSTDFKEKENALLTLTTISQADPSIGASIVSTGNLIEDWLDTSEFESEAVVVAMLDALCAVASDTGMRKTIGTTCAEWLSRLIMGNNMRYRIRAAITLTKCLAINPESRDQLVEGGIDTSKIILEVLADKSHPLDVRQAAVEGLAYLSVYAPMKEKVMANKNILETLYELSKIDDKALQYGISSTLSNLSVYQPKLSEEQQQIMKLKEIAKEYVPKTHPLDEDEAVEKRVTGLVNTGAVTALVALSKTSSANIREALANIFHSMATNPKNRGTIVQQGGVPALLRLANEGTQKGKDIASQALAKIAITMDPNIAFKGERAAEMVRPLLRLLKSEDGLQNFEALMALTNLASMSQEVLTRIVKEKGISEIEFMMFSEHHMIQRAATECMCNMMYSDDVVDVYANAPTSERMKIFIGLSDVEDHETRRAASGCLAIMSSNEKICRHLKNEKITLEVLITLLGDKPELQHRAVEVIKNLSSYPDIAKWLVESGLLEPIQILSYSENQAIKESAGVAYQNLLEASKS